MRPVPRTARRRSFDCDGAPPLARSVRGGSAGLVLRHRQQQPADLPVRQRLRQLGKQQGDLLGTTLARCSCPIVTTTRTRRNVRSHSSFAPVTRSPTCPCGWRSDDREIWWSISAKPQLDADGEFLGYRGSAKDITAVRERQRDASRLAQFDSLTGLANRHRMTKRLTSTLTAYKAAKRSCALMMLDLDRFKAGQRHPRATLRATSCSSRSPSASSRIIGTRGGNRPPGRRRIPGHAARHRRPRQARRNRQAASSR